MTEQKHYRTCNICEAMCGLIITHTKDRVISVKPDPDDPLSRGHICPKAVALQDFRTDPDRVTAPLLKVDGAFKEVSWEEALDVATTRLRAVQEAYGKDAVGVYLGNPNAHKFGNLLNLPGLVRALGTKNRYSSATADQIPHHVASIHMLGHPMLMPIPDVDRTDFMLILGGNPLVSNGSMMTAPGFGKRMDEIAARGGQVVVIDPRRTETAEKAAAHHFIRPETDAVLLLALIHEVFATGKQRLGHLEPVVSGLDALQAAAAPFTPEMAAEVTGIDAGTIRALAASFIGAKRAVCYARMGASTQSFGGLSLWAAYALNVITGNFDAEGGAMFTMPAFDYAGMTSRKGKVRSYPEARSRVSGQPLYNGEFPVSVMAEEMETAGDGQIKALVTVAGNPVLTAPNGRRIERAIEKLEFVICVDIHINDTSRHADLILPGTVALEEAVYDMVFHSFAVRNTAAYARPLFDPPKNVMPEWELIARLTDRLETPDQRLHLAPSVYLEDLPRLLAFVDQRDADYPFAMIGRRQVRSHNSWTQNSPRLVKGRNRCTVEVNITDADRLGISDGMDVRVSSRVGTVTLPVEITDTMAPGVVSIPQGWGQSGDTISVAASAGTVSINDLTDDRRIDPLTGNAAFNGVPVRIDLAS
ncbi:molybdopterin oxidoreductase family protein [Sulfitobacter sp. SH22]|jgi:anaerobic selenocysteine-containing dehydrogenase|uniref:molybdopterin oxidoreductase family protein n=1 Tax=Sulfitobacter sp. SH22 TaxID=3421172 RepID=UPI003F50CF74